MPSVGDISVRLTAITAEFKKDMREAANVTSSWKDVAQAAAIASGAAFAGLTAIIAKTTDAAETQWRAEEKLSLAFRAAGKAIDTTGLREYASELQKTTNFGDEATLGAMSMLASFQLNDKQIRQLIPAVQDIAEFMGTDLDSAARRVGVSIASGTNTMQEAGLAMTAGQRKAFQLADAHQRVAMMADLMGQKVGGVAKGLANPFTQLSNSVGDLEEQIGFLFRDAVRSKASALRDVVTNLTERLAAMSPETRATAGTMILVAQGLAGATAGMAGFALVLPSIAKGFAMMAPVIGGVGAIALGLIGLIAIVGVVRQAWDINVGSMQEKFAAFADKVKEIASSIGGWLNQYVVRPFIYAHAYVSGQNRSMADETWKSYQEKPPSIDVVGALATSGSAVADVAKSAATSLLETLKSGGGALRSLVQPIIDRILAAFPRASSSDGGGSKGSGASDFSWISLMAKKGMQDATEAWLAAAWGDSALSAGETFAAKFYNAVVEFTSSFAGGLTNIAANSAAALGEAGSAFAGAVVNGISGLAGDVLKAAQQGFAQGGVWGAIGGMVGTLLTNSSTFKGIMAGVNGTLQNISQLLGTILQPLGAIMQIMNPMVQLLNEYVAPVLQLFADAIGKVLFTVIKGVTLVVLGVAWAIGKAWNGIVSSIQWTFRKIGDIPFMGKFNDWADSLDRLKINTDKLSDAMSTLDGMTYDQAVAANEAAGADQAKTDAAQELLNVPTGYKLDLTRYESAMGDAYRGSPSQAPTFLPPAGDDNRILITNFNVNGENAQDTADKVLKALERRTYVRTGSTSGVGLPYATPAIP